MLSLAGRRRMMSNNTPMDDLEERGIWSRVKDRLGFSDIEEDYDDGDEAGTDSGRRPTALRIQTSRVSHVSVRLPQSFDDARLAADGLKDGRQQIINLEKTTAEMSERIIDFLNGVTYALNGFVEKVGDRVYLFAPCNVMIDVPDDLHKGSPMLFDGHS
jgi:hypothetical protein